jgi:hypothetical protein
MRKLIAMALLGASAVFFSATVPAQAMTAGSAGIAKSAVPDAGSVHEVRRRWGHRHYRRWNRHRHYGYRRWNRPYYYGGYGGYYGSPYYYPRYYRRPGIRLYFGF